MRRPGGDDPIGVHTINDSFANVQRHWAKPTWINFYGTPRHVNTAKPLVNLPGSKKLDRAKLTRAMNTGMMPGSTYRGRALIACSVKRDVAEPRCIENGEGAFDLSALPVRPPPPPRICIITLDSWGAVFG